MRIECPDCAAAYEVPDHLLAGRKTIRCSRCGREWNVGSTAEAAEIASEPDPQQLDRAEIDEVAVPATAEIAPPPPRPLNPTGLGRPSVSAMQRLVQTAPPPPRSSIWPSVAWVVSLVVLAVLIWAAFNWRADIMQLWPPSTRVYAALGLVRSTR